MSIRVHETDDLPDADYYVTAWDTFMSGWGEAEGGENIVILPCESASEARIVEANARARGDMAAVTVHPCKPDMPADSGRGYRYTYDLMTKDVAARWYREGGWT